MSDTKQLDLIDVERQEPRDRVTRLLDIAEKQNLDIQIIDGCVEPGYDDKPVALGNWNDRTEYNRETRVSKVTDSTMPRLAKLLEKLGYECEWEDEWTQCQGCYKAVRTSPNSYSWKLYYWIEDVSRELLCGDCVKDDPAEYLEWLSRNAKQCMQLDIDLSKHGYELHGDEYANGWHPGQNDDPVEIASQLKKEGITDFIFKLDGKGQFDIHFSVWVKK